MQIAIFGLGKMGMQIAKRLHTAKFEVLAWNRSEGPRLDFKKFGGQSFASLDELSGKLCEKPRIFWLMLPHITVEDFLFSQTLLGGVLRKGDIVIDGGNSFYKDSVKRAEGLRANGVEFYDCGVSGGVWGEKNGFALMVGGDKKNWEKIEPIFKVLSSGDNYGLVGANGAGHFVKMVHNGIEYGMMEAIGEGYGILQASEFKLDLNQVTKIYQQGTVIRSWLIDLVKNIFETKEISSTKGEIMASGEGEWTVNTAKELGLDVRVIEDALKVRQESLDPKTHQKFSNKIVALLRKQFGGHGVVK